MIYDHSFHSNTKTYFSRISTYHLSFIFCKACFLYDRVMTGLQGLLTIKNNVITFFRVIKVNFDKGEIIIIDSKVKL